MLKLIAGVIAVITALGGYMSWKYGTTSSCEAAGKAMRDEMPAVIDELAETDIRFRALKVGGALLNGVDAFATGIAAEMAKDAAQDASAVECVMMVGRRELDPSGFRKAMGERMGDELAQRLPF